MAYIDVLAVMVGEFCDRVPIAFVIEPDLILNLITNLDNDRCGVNDQLPQRHSMRSECHLASMCFGQYLR